MKGSYILIGRKSVILLEQMFALEKKSMNSHIDFFFLLELTAQGSVHFYLVLSFFSGQSPDVREL